VQINGNFKLDHVLVLMPAHQLTDVSALGNVHAIHVMILLSVRCININVVFSLTKILSLVSFTVKK
jgi:hypothetical protein